MKETKTIYSKTGIKISISANPDKRIEKMIYSSLAPKHFREWDSNKNNSNKNQS